MEQDKGASAKADRAASLTASAVPASQSGIPSAGEWVLFRDSSYSWLSVDLKQAVKVTPKLVKFDGGWPRQCNIVAVVASFADKATAERVRDSIGGISGEYSKARRAAEDERSRRITAALEKANRQIEKIIAREKGGAA